MLFPEAKLRLNTPYKTMIYSDFSESHPYTSNWTDLQGKMTNYIFSGAILRIIASILSLNVLEKETDKSLLFK